MPTMAMGVSSTGKKIAGIFYEKSYIKEFR
jgi:hypothetical protein